MGLFDIFKSKEELQRNEVLENMRKQVFPNGQDQIDKETRELRDLLQFKYTKEEVVRTYVHAAGIYFVSQDKSQDRIITSILRHPQSVVTKEDAIKVYNFLKERFSKENKKRSFQLIANQYKCMPTEVKDEYLNSMKKQGFSKATLQQIIKGFQEKIYEESRILNMPVEDTPAAIMESWTKEYLTELDVKEKEAISNSELILAQYPDLDKIISIQNKAAVLNYLAKHPDKLNSILEEITNDDELAEICLALAYDLIDDEKDYNTAFYILSKGIEYKDIYCNSRLYFLRAECRLNLNSYLSGVYDLDEAIVSFTEEIDDNEFRSECYNLRAVLNSKLEDYAEAAEDRKNADKFYELWLKDKQNEKNDGLPF